MKLLIFILNKEELLEDVLKAFVEAGVPDATVLDSERMGGFLTYEVPLFAGFREFLSGSKPYNRTIFTVVKKEEQVTKVVELLEKVCGSLSKSGAGILFTVPVDYARGLTSEEE